MEVHKWSGWKRIHNRGDVMEFIMFFVVSIAVIWGILEYFEVGNDWLDYYDRVVCNDIDECGYGWLVMWLGSR